MNSICSRALRVQIRLPVRSAVATTGTQVRCFASAKKMKGKGKGKGGKGREKERERERDRNVPMLPRKRASTPLDQTVIPQLSTGELRSIYSQELFVFRCDVTATQISSAMTSYPTLRDVGVLTPDDISNLSRQIHTKYRLTRNEDEVFKHIERIIADLKSGEIPGHPLASVHLMSCLKDMERFEVANEFWKWLIEKGETHCDARVYGVAIENYTYQGVAQEELEKMFMEALERYSETVDPKVARDTGRATRLMLLQGIITARILHGDWRGAYEGFDISVRLYPTLTPARMYELFLYERPVKEAYIVFLMACRAGTPPKPPTLTPLLKEIWAKHRDVKAMIRLVYAFVGAGGKPFPQHLNSLIFAILGSLPSDASKNKGEEFDKMFDATMALIRDLISAFSKLQVYPSEGTFNTIISLGGKLQRLDLVHGGMKELLAAHLTPNMVTYRTIVNAFGEMKDKEQFQASWEDLCAARKGLDIPWDIKDFIALIKGGLNLDMPGYVCDEIEANKQETSYELYRKSLGKMYSLRSRMRNASAAPPSAASSTTEPSFSQPTPQTIATSTTEPPPSQQSLQTTTPKPTLVPSPLFDLTKRLKIRSEVDNLSTIFTSGKIYDFASSPVFTTTTTPTTTPSNNNNNNNNRPREKIVDIDFATPDIIPPSELQSFYAALTNSVSKVSSGEDALTRTATGYTVKELRFENWRSINRLLFEAELFEKEMIEKRIRGMVMRGKQDGVVAVDGGEGGAGDMKKMFEGEERAKKRIEDVRRGIKGVKRAQGGGEVGWRKEELRVRGLLGRDVKIEGIEGLEEV